MQFQRGQHLHRAGRTLDHSLAPFPHAQPITTEELGAISGPAAMHAIGHVAANLSFAAVAISLTHTVKTLEPAFNVALSQLILGEREGGVRVGADLGERNTEGSGRRM